MPSNRDFIEKVHQHGLQKYNNNSLSGVQDYESVCFTKPQRS